MKKLMCVLAMGVLQTTIAFAGNEGGGGGKGFLCNESGEQRMYLADTYQLHKSGVFGKYEGQDALNFERAVEIIDNKFPQKVYAHPFIKGQKVTFGWMLAHVHNGLHFEEYNWNDPKEINDDNIKVVPANCTKVQIAYQNLKTGVVRVRRTQPMIGGADWFYLQLHETLIAMRGKPGMDTTEIRQKVSRLATILANPENFSLQVLKEMAYEYRPDPVIVPQNKQTRFRTLYYSPRALTCAHTWTGQRSEYNKVSVAIPSVINLVRTSGDGRVGEHNKYRMGKIKSTETDLYTESYNAFGEADGIGTFSLSMKFKVTKSLGMEINLHTYDQVTGEYLGDFDYDDETKMKVVDLDSGYGLRCWPSETPIFRVDERSSVYGEPN